MGRMQRSTVLLSISMRPSVRNRFRPFGNVLESQPCWGFSEDLRTALGQPLLCAAAFSLGEWRGVHQQIGPLSEAQYGKDFNLLEALFGDGGDIIDVHVLTDTNARNH